MNTVDYNTLSDDDKERYANGMSTSFGGDVSIVNAPIDGEVPISVEQEVVPTSMDPEDGVMVDDSEMDALFDTEGEADVVEAPQVEQAPLDELFATEGVDQEVELDELFATEGVDSVSTPTKTFKDAMIHSTGQAESRGDSSAVSSTGVKGTFQITRNTARQYGYDPNAADYDENLVVADIMDDLIGKYGEDSDKIYAAYNAGEGSVNAAIKLATKAGDESKWMDYLNVKANKPFQSVLAIPAVKKAGITGAKKLKEVTGGQARLKRAMEAYMGGGSFAPQTKESIYQVSGYEYNKGGFLNTAKGAWDNLVAMATAPSDQVVNMFEAGGTNVAQGTMNTIADYHSRNANVAEGGSRKKMEFVGHLEEYNRNNETSHTLEEVQSDDNLFNKIYTDTYNTGEATQKSQAQYTEDYKEKQSVWTSITADETKRDEKLAKSTEEKEAFKKASGLLDEVRRGERIKNAMEGNGTWFDNAWKKAEIGVRIDHDITRALEDDNLEEARKLVELRNAIQEGLSNGDTNLGGQIAEGFVGLLPFIGGFMAKQVALGMGTKAVAGLAKTAKGASTAINVGTKASRLAMIESSTNQGMGDIASSIIEADGDPTTESAKTKILVGGLAYSLSEQLGMKAITGGTSKASNRISKVLMEKFSKSPVMKKIMGHAGNATFESAQEGVQKIATETTVQLLMEEQGLDEATAMERAQKVGIDAGKEVLMSLATMGLLEGFKGGGSAIISNATSNGKKATTEKQKKVKQLQEDYVADEDKTEAEVEVEAEEKELAKPKKKKEAAKLDKEQLEGFKYDAEGNPINDEGEVELIKFDDGADTKEEPLVKFDDGETTDKPSTDKKLTPVEEERRVALTTRLTELDKRKAEIENGAEAKEGELNDINEEIAYNEEALREIRDGATTEKPVVTPPTDNDEKVADIEKRRSEEISKKVNDKFSRNADQQVGLEDNQEAPLLIGQEYNGGMKVDASFVDNRTDTSKDGVQIITKVTKPQINTDGKMTQMGAVEVTIYSSKVKAAADIKAQKEKVSKLREKKTAEINAKYDAELEGLSSTDKKPTKPVETPTVDKKPTTDTKPTTKKKPVVKEAPKTSETIKDNKKTKVERVDGNITKEYKSFDSQSATPEARVENEVESSKLLEGIAPTIESTTDNVVTMEDVGSNEVGDNITEQDVIDVAKAVSAMHKAGVVHNDLHMGIEDGKKTKGSNIIRDKDGNIRVIDFEESARKDNEYFDEFMEDEVSIFADDQIPAKYKQLFLDTYANKEATVKPVDNSKIMKTLLKQRETLNNAIDSMGADVNPILIEKAAELDGKIEKLAKKEGVESPLTVKEAVKEETSGGTKSVIDAIISTVDTEGHPMTLTKTAENKIKQLKSGIDGYKKVMTQLRKASNSKLSHVLKLAFDEDTKNGDTKALEAIVNAIGPGFGRPKHPLSAKSLQDSDALDNIIKKSGNVGKATHANKTKDVVDKALVKGTTIDNKEKYTNKRIDAGGVDLKFEMNTKAKDPSQESIEAFIKLSEKYPDGVIPAEQLRVKTDKVMGLDNEAEFDKNTLYEMQDSGLITLEGERSDNTNKSGENIFDMKSEGISDQFTTKNNEIVSDAILTNTADNSQQTDRLAIMNEEAELGDDRLIDEIYVERAEERQEADEEGDFDESGWNSADYYNYGKYRGTSSEAISDAADIAREEMYQNREIDDFDTSVKDLHGDKFRPLLNAVTRPLIKLQSVMDKDLFREVKALLGTGDKLTSGDVITLYRAVGGSFDASQMTTAQHKAHMEAMNALEVLRAPIIAEFNKNGKTASELIAQIKSQYDGKKIPMHVATTIKMLESIKGDIKVNLAFADELSDDNGGFFEEMNLIVIGENSEYSFAHEMGHWYFENVATMAERIAYRKHMYNTYYSKGTSTKAMAEGFMEKAGLDGEVASNIEASPDEFFAEFSGMYSIATASQNRLAEKFQKFFKTLLENLKSMVRGSSKVYDIDTISLFETLIKRGLPKATEKTADPENDVDVIEVSKGVFKRVGVRNIRQESKGARKVWLAANMINQTNNLSAAMKKRIIGHLSTKKTITEADITALRGIQHAAYLKNHATKLKKKLDTLKNLKKNDTVRQEIKVFRQENAKLIEDIENGKFDYTTELMDAFVANEVSDKTSESIQAIKRMAMNGTKQASLIIKKQVQKERDARKEKQAERAKMIEGLQEELKKSHGHYGTGWSLFKSFDTMMFDMGNGDLDSFFVKLGLKYSDAEIEQTRVMGELIEEYQKILETNGAETNNTSSVEYGKHFDNRSSKGAKFRNNDDVRTQKTNRHVKSQQVTLGGKKITLTESQLAGLINISLDPEGKFHLYGPLDAGGNPTGKNSKEYGIKFDKHLNHITNITPSEMAVISENASQNVHRMAKSEREFYMKLAEVVNKWSNEKNGFDLYTPSENHRSLKIFRNANTHEEKEENFKSLDEIMKENFTHFSALGSDPSESKARKKDAKGAVVLEDAADNALRVINDMATYMAFDGVKDDMLKTFAGVEEMMKGDEVNRGSHYDSIKAHIFELFVRQYSANPTSKVLRAMSSAGAKGILGFKASTAAMQSTSYLGYISMVDSIPLKIELLLRGGLVTTGNALAQISASSVDGVSHLAGAVTGIEKLIDMNLHEATMQRMYDRSETARQRIASGAIDQAFTDTSRETALRNLIKQTQTKDGSPAAKRAWTVAKRMPASWIRTMDLVAIDTIYKLAERHVQYENKGIDRDSQEYIDMVEEKFRLGVRMTQPHNDGTSIAGFQRSETMRMLMPFVSQRSKNANMILRANTKAVAGLRAMRQGDFGEGLEKFLSGLIDFVVIGLMMPAAIGTIKHVWGALAKELEMDDKSEWIKQMGHVATGNIPLGGDIAYKGAVAASGGSTPYGSMGTLVSGVEPALYRFLNAVESEDKGRMLRSGAELGMFFGLPVGNMFELIDVLGIEGENIITGEDFQEYR